MNRNTSEAAAEERAFYLPDFCAPRTALAVVLIAELTAVVVTLARENSGVGFWTDLARTSLFLLWIGLAGAALLCAARRYLSQQSVVRGSALVLVLVAAVVAGVSEIAWQAGETMWFADTPDLLPRSHAAFVLRNVAISLIASALALRYSYVTHEWRRNIEMQAQARVHALQARIRPHFLFNSMNTIASLTRSNPARAESAVLDLADLFRAALSERRNEVPLREELEAARTYQRVEQLRLGSRLEVVWKVDQLPMHALVPGLIVQPLLENAIYHGIEPAEGGGEVAIEVTCSGGELAIRLTNPFKASGDHHAGNKMALANIRERLQLHFDAEASMQSRVADGTYEVTIRLPYITAPR